MSDELIHICTDCGSINSNERCSCGSIQQYKASRNDDYYYNDDPTNYTNDELDKYDEK